MSYTRHTWIDDESVTYEKLNNIEDGVEEASSSGGYDAVITIYHDNISAHDYEFAIESGSYAALKAKLMVNDPPVILAKVWDELAGYNGATTMTSLYVYPRSDAPDNSVVFTVKMPSSSASTHTGWFGIALEWNSSDEVTVW